ncbi:MAG: glycosyltransferase, partial [Thermomicrobiales bacterium]
MNQSPMSAPVGAPTVPQDHPHLSIVIPVYNEADRIGPCLEQLSEWMSQRDERIEVLVVDDGSSDDTLAIATQAASGNSAITVVSEPHLGKANAVLAGLSTARGTYAGFCDVDLATPLATWDDCDAAFAYGADIAIASREGRGAIRVGEPWYRHAMGRAFNGLIRLMLLPGIHDTQCGFKFFRRE